MANEYAAWKGAVEPAESVPLGNEVQLYKGAVEPASIVSGGTISRRVTLVALFDIGINHG